MQSTKQNKTKHKSSHFRNAKCPLNKMNERWQMFNMNAMNVRVFICCTSFSLKRKKKQRDGKMEIDFSRRMEHTSVLLLLSYGMFVHLIVKDNISIRYAQESVVSTAAAQCTLTAVIRVSNKWGESTHRTHDAHATHLNRKHRNGQIESSAMSKWETK